jgi:hypothetical protein
MALPIKLKDIIEGMEFQTDEGASHLHTTTGEVVYITDEEVRAAEDETPLDHFPQWQHEAIRVAKDFLESRDSLPLPTKALHVAIPSGPARPPMRRFHSP